MSKDLMELPKGNGKPLDVDVVLEAIPDPAVTDIQALEAFKRAGLVMVGVDTVKDLAAIGIYVKGVGVLKIQRGRAMITQQKLDEAIRVMSEHMVAIHNDSKLKPRTKTNDLVKSAGVLASLTRGSTDSQRLAIELESMTVVTGAPVTDTPVPMNSFQPKAKITPVNTTIHNHGPTQVLVQERKPE